MLLMKEFQGETLRDVMIRISRRNFVWTSHWTWSGPTHEVDLPCWWLGDNPLRPNSVEFGNHSQVHASKGFDVRCKYPDNWV